MRWLEAYGIKGNAPCYSCVHIYQAETNRCFVRTGIPYGQHEWNAGSAIGRHLPNHNAEVAIC